MGSGSVCVNFEVVQVCFCLLLPTTEMIQSVAPSIDAKLFLSNVLSNLRVCACTKTDTLNPSIFPTDGSPPSMMFSPPQVDLSRSPFRHTPSLVDYHIMPSPTPFGPRDPQSSHRVHTFVPSPCSKMETGF